MLLTLLLTVVTCWLVLIAIQCIFAWRRRYVRKLLTSNYGLDPKAKLIAFFHPHCNAGGGGERVLWTALRAMSLKSEPKILIIYTGDPLCFSNKQSVFSTVERTFGTSVKSATSDSSVIIHFVPLYSVRLLSASVYPVFTLMGQAIGSLIVGFEALLRCPPDLFVDTTGCAFTLPLAKWFARCLTAAYVHYPTISSDMLKRISHSSNSCGKSLTPYNNAEWIRNSRLISFFKFYYYQLIILAYKWVGCSMNANLVMTNSSWTRNHIKSLWGGSPTVLYPPCPIPRERSKNEKQRPWIMSIGQFRPEKNHELQLNAFTLLLKRLELLHRPSEDHDFRLLLIGGCRDATDKARVIHLKRLAHSLGVENVVDFHLNVSYDALQHYFKTCSINLHTMIDEHFGIGIVEGMAHGLITIANNSGGPKADIIGPAQSKLTSTVDHSDSKDFGVGYLASTSEEYADVMKHILIGATTEERTSIQIASRQRALNLFSEESFVSGWSECMKRLDL